MLAIIFGLKTGSIDPYAIPFVFVLSVFLLGIPSRMLRG